MRRWLCWIGLHRWWRVDAPNDVRVAPRRFCECCEKHQRLYRGAGADQWFDYFPEAQTDDC